MRQRIPYGLAAVLATALLIGCTQVNKIANSAVEASTEAMFGDVGPGISMDRMTMQMFRVMFYQGGYVLQTRDFEPGEYVRWDVVGEGNTNWSRKALLRRRDDGAEWWRLTMQMQEDRIVIEALLEAEDDSGERRILRMRRQFSEQESPEEVPITKDNADKWTLHRQRELTNESYEGLKVGTASVRVPAGMFTTEHLRGSHPRYGGTVHWYLTDKVPGGLVKYRSERDGDTRVLELTQYGSGKTSSELGVF